MSKKLGPSFKRASAINTQPVCAGLDNLQKIVKRYITRGLGGKVLSVDNAGGSHLPVISYRLPQHERTNSFVIGRKSGETTDDMLKRLAGNVGVKYTPKWIQQVPRAA